MLKSRPIAACFAAAFLAATVSSAAGCGSSNRDPSTAMGKRAILDDVRKKLTDQDCSGAIETLKPVYNSEYSDNDVRMLMAATYGCAATINLFTLLGEIGTNSAEIVAGGLWAFLADQFPSTSDDRIPEAGQLAQDALQAVISPSAVILSNNLFNIDTDNPAAYYVADRISSANAYLFFTSMATIGGYESRYGNPLPWTAATDVDAEGCAYASAVVNFVDSMDGLEDSTTGQLQTNIASMKSAFQSAVYQACDLGCITCGIAAGCSTCPKELRDRAACTAEATDPASCAAAQLVTLINTQWALFP